MTTPDPSLSSSSSASQLLGVRGPITYFATHEAGTSWYLELKFGLSLTFPGIMRRSGWQCTCTRTDGRPSPMNLSRPSSFCTANTPETSLGSSEEVAIRRPIYHDLLPSVPRTLPKPVWDPVKRWQYAGQFAT